MTTFKNFVVLLFLSTLTCLGYVSAKSKVQIASVIPLEVAHPPKMAVPIKFSASGYNGPYDPADPEGLGAARRRELKILREKNAALVKSYIPPGLGKEIKKQGVKLAVKEGERFAFAHPKETADLVGIAMKAKSFYALASKKLKKAEEASGHVVTGHSKKH